MRSWSRYALLSVAVVGWAAAAWIGYILMTRLGWFGVMLIGIAILFPALCAELHDETPAASPLLLRRRYQQTFEGNAESRLARWAERLRQHRNLYIARTIGIALTLLGLNEFIVHQL